MLKQHTEESILDKLQSCNISQLHVLRRKYGLSGCSKYSKKELINVLKNRVKKHDFPVHISTFEEMMEELKDDYTY